MQSRSLSSEFKLLSPNNTVNKTVQYTDAKGRLKFERAMSEMGKGIQWRIHNSQKISNFLHANDRFQNLHMQSYIKIMSLFVI